MPRSPLHLVVTQAITEDEARARLSALESKAIKAARLAREWGWSRWKTRQFIAACRAEGLIPPNAGKANGKPKPQAKLTPVHETEPASAAAVEAAPESNAQGGTQVATRLELQRDNVPPPFEPSDTMPDEPKDGDEPVKRKRYNPPPPPDEPAGGKALALILGTAAIVLGGIGLVLNITFAQSFGSSPFAAVLLAVLGGVIDVMTIILPTAAGKLWAQKHYGPSLGAWACWCGGLIMTLIAASGFAATNIGDAVKGRSIVTDERAGLTAKLEHLRSDRNVITEARSPAAIEAAIQQEKPRIPAANWKASVGCTDVTTSGKVCAKLNTLRQAKADAERREQLDAAITTAEETLKGLPAYVSADPGAEMGAKILTAATAGLIKVTPEVIQQIRIAGLTAAPAASGLLLFFAILTWRPRRDEFLVPSLV